MRQPLLCGKILFHGFLVRQIKCDRAIGVFQRSDEREGPQDALSEEPFLNEWTTLSNEIRVPEI